MKTFIIILFLSVSTMASDYYVYICPSATCDYSTIKRNPGSMNCPVCMRNKQDYRYMNGEKIEQTKN
jgi:cellobiose-specific phosphotransferase system component IIB